MSRLLNSIRSNEKANNVNTQGMTSKSSSSTVKATPTPTATPTAKATATSNSNNNKHRNTTTPPNAKKRKRNWRRRPKVSPSQYPRQSQRITNLNHSSVHTAMCLPVQKKSLLDDNSVWRRLGSLRYAKRVNRFGGVFKSSNLQVNGETQWTPSRFLQILRDNNLQDVADKIEDEFSSMGVNLLLGNCFVKQYEEEDYLSTHRDVSRDTKDKYTFTMKFGEGHRMSIKKELLTTFALPAELVVQHDNQMTLLTPWANCIYTHSVPVPAEPSVDYTIVCFVEVQNKSYIVSNYFDLNGGKVVDSDVVEFNISSDLISTYLVVDADVKCDKCNKTYSTPENLNTHIRNIHSDHDTQVNCETCGTTLANVDSLKKHIKRKHSDRDTRVNCET